MKNLLKQVMLAEILGLSYVAAAYFPVTIKETIDAAGYKTITIERTAKCTEKFYIRDTSVLGRVLEGDCDIKINQKEDL